LAELSIETKVFTDVSLAQVALSGARFVAVVVDCDLAGANSLLNREGSPSKRAAIFVCRFHTGQIKGIKQCGFCVVQALAKTIGPFDDASCLGSNVVLTSAHLQMRTCPTYFCLQFGERISC
jgi:hypothetical protein